MAPTTANGMRRSRGRYAGPAKRRLIKNWASLPSPSAEARYGDALHQASRDLLSLWLDWAGAAHAIAAVEAARFDCLGSNVVFKQRLPPMKGSRAAITIAGAPPSRPPARPAKVPGWRHAPISLAKAICKMYCRRAASCSERS